jgi:hypothetical protein
VAKLRTVKAWAAYRDGKFHDVFNPRIYRTQRGAKFYAGDDEVKPVRIVPEAEYRAMRAAVRLAEEISSQRYDANRAYPKLLVDRYEQSKRKAR